jgi:anaerobic magnesium-protoporphyrin IX monomethyl ester cyclase
VKVLFLEIDQERTWAVASIGPAFLAAYLRQHGQVAVMRRVAPEAAPDAIEALVRAEAPDLIGLSLTTRQWPRARVVAGDLRARLDIPVVAGGLHPSFAAGEVLRHPGFDYVCVGEGEQALLQLVEALAAPGRSGVGDPPIPNIQVRGAPPSPCRPPFEPIDALPFMARDFLDEHYGCLHMATQRGCPFPCTYCAARMFDELYAGERYGRRRSHGNVLAEIDALRAAGPVNYFIFIDDTFTIHPAWVRGFCQVYERFRIPFSLHARVETVSEDMIGRLAAAGCRHIVYGVESGSERVRREIMHRPVGNARFEEVFRWTKRAGILATANYMLGLPGESRADIEATIALHERLQPDDFGYFVFYPYPGTTLFQTCRDEGMLPPDYLDRPANHRASILRLPDLTPADIDEYYERFTRLREQVAVRRLGAAATEEGKKIATADVRLSASLG